MITVLYVNHGLGTRCGVYDFGVRHFNALPKNDGNEYHYAEITSIDHYLATCVRVRPDVVIFNYMQMLLPWVTDAVRTFPAKRVVVQHLYDDGSVSRIMDSYGGIFDYMICLDPSLPSTDPRIFAMGRPIPKFSSSKKTLVKGEEVSVGSFGFGLPHKQFPLIMREINKSFDNAVFNLHMTVGDFVQNLNSSIVAACEAEITKPGIRLNHTYDYKDENSIVEMLNSNHMNALFYDLPAQNAGLSSSVDYMVAAQRPMLVTDCASFKHIANGVYVYPYEDFDYIANNYELCQKEASHMYNGTVNNLGRDTTSMLIRIL